MGFNSGFKGLNGRLVCRFAYQTVIYTEWHIPDVVLIQLILLMMDMAARNM